MEREEYVAADMWALYRLRVADCVDAATYSLFVQLLERLNYEEKSMWRAHSAGYPGLFSWGKNVEVLASLVEEVRVLQGVVIAMVSKKRPKVERYEGRPTSGVRVAKNMREMAQMMEIPRYVPHT